MEEKIYSISLAGGQRFVLVINDHHPPWHCPPWHCPSWHCPPWHCPPWHCPPWHCPPWHCPPWHQYHPLGAQVSCGRGGGGHCRWPCSWLGIVVSFPITLICLSINDTICHHPYMIVIETILIVITRWRYISTCIGPILEPTPSLSQTTRCRFEQQLMMSKLFITSNAQPNGSKSWWCWWRCRWIQTETLVMNSSMAMLLIRVDNGLPWCQTASRNQGRLRFTLEKGRSLLFLGLRWSPWSSGGCSGLTGEGSQR